MTTATKKTSPLARLAGFIGRSQSACLAQCLRGEEREWFVERLGELAATIETMPETYGQDGKGDAAIAYLHYFTAGCDWYITEKDCGTIEDSGDEFQWQAFGMADVGYGGELGYICLPELLAAGAELDLHWTPKTLGEIKE